MLVKEGSMPDFYKGHFVCGCQVQLEAVEIDPEMSKVAREWFGFSHDRNVVVHIVDGLDYIRNLGTKCKYFLCTSFASLRNKLRVQ